MKMRSRKLSLVALLLGWIAACTQTRDVAVETQRSTVENLQPNSTTAFVGVDVLPMDRDVLLRDQTVLVRDGRIAALGDAAKVEVPADAERIDGKGKWLMPGLTEMHGHVPGPDEPQYAQDMLLLYLANGVTTVRNMAGHPWHLELRKQVESNALPGPNLIAASPWLSADTPAEADWCRGERVGGCGT